MKEEGKKELELELYKISIEGYQKHWDHYNHWMNMYAIFNGALFVGMYSIIKETKEELIIFQLCICVLGCISAWFWLFSARGFYRWLISWIKIVKKHEKFFVDDILTSFDAEYKDKKMYVYNLFIKAGNEKYFKTRPFSTQKLTQWFAGSVAFVWTFITIMFIAKNYEKLEVNTRFFIWVLPFFVIVLCFISFCRESNLKKTHVVLDS